MLQDQASARYRCSLILVKTRAPLNPCIEALDLALATLKYGCMYDNHTAIGGVDLTFCSRELPLPKGRGFQFHRLEQL